MSQVDSFSSSQPKDPQSPEVDHETQVSFTPCAADWADAPREVLRGLAEEAPQDSATIDDTPRVDEPITAERRHGVMAGRNGGAGR